LRQRGKTGTDTNLLLDGVFLFFIYIFPNEKTGGKNGWLGFLLTIGLMDITFLFENI